MEALTARILPGDRRASISECAREQMEEYVTERRSGFRARVFAVWNPPGS
jgi:hypothetical protein